MAEPKTHEEIIKLTREQAETALISNQDGSVHTFVQSGYALIGADRSKDSINEMLASAELLQIGGENCRAMEHGVVIDCGNSRFFLHADNDKLKEYEEAKC